MELPAHDYRAKYQREVLKLKALEKAVADLGYSPSYHRGGKYGGCAVTLHRDRDILEREAIAKVRAEWGVAA